MTLVGARQIFSGRRFLVQKYDRVSERIDEKLSPLAHDNFFKAFDGLAEMVVVDTESREYGYTKTLFVGGIYQTMLRYTESRVESDTRLGGVEETSNPKINVSATGEEENVKRLYSDLSSRLGIR